MAFFLSFCGWIGAFSVVFFGKRGLGLGWGGLPAGRCAEIRSSTFVFWAFRRDDFFHKMIPEWLLLFATSIFLDHIYLYKYIYLKIYIYVSIYLYLYIYICTYSKNKQIQFFLKNIRTQPLGRNWEFSNGWRFAVRTTLREG